MDLRPALLALALLCIPALSAAADQVLDVAQASESSIFVWRVRVHEPGGFVSISHEGSSRVGEPLHESTWIGGVSGFSHPSRSPVALRVDTAQAEFGFAAPRDRDGEGGGLGSTLPAGEHVVAVALAGEALQWSMTARLEGSPTVELLGRSVGPARVLQDVDFDGAFVARTSLVGVDGVTNHRSMDEATATVTTTHSTFLTFFASGDAQPDLAAHTPDGYVEGSPWCGQSCRDWVSLRAGAPGQTTLVARDVQGEGTFFALVGDAPIP